jgi:predicted nucleic acid-binding protein
VITIPFPHDHLVLDTSVIIKWYRQGEVLAQQALALRTAYLAGEVTVSVPSLLVYEVTNVLRYKNDLSADQVKEAVQSLFDMDLDIMSPSLLIIDQAVELARTYNITVYDATFVALAQALSATFVTADERLAQRLADLSFVHSLDEVIV